MTSFTSPFPLRGKVAEGRMRADAQHQSSSEQPVQQDLRAMPAALILRIFEKNAFPAATFSQGERGEGVMQ